jgi:uncharacterized membrane protein
MTDSKSSKEKAPVKKTSVKTTPKLINSDKVLSWQAPDYYTFEKSPFWSLSVGVLAIATAALLIYTNNYFPVIIIILAVIVTFQVSHQKPKAQEFILDEGGAIIRNEYIPYLELKSFWSANHGSKSILYFEPVSSLKAAIVVPLGKQSVNEVRNFLLAHLPERLEYGEMLSEKLIRIFKL